MNPILRTGEPARQKQSGQAIVAGVIMLLIVSAAVYVLFSRSQLAIEKQRLNNTADAAAYSAALWRARVMNYHAYSNRAIVAQEVAVAQAVTLASWAEYFKTFTENINHVARYYAPLTAITGPLASTAAVNQTLTEAAARAEILARAAKDIGYKFLLEKSQQLMNLTANGFALNLITAEVAKANHNDSFAFVLPTSDAGFKWVKRYESQSERERLREVVFASLDSFTGGARNEDTIFGVPIPGSGKKKACIWGLFKRGGTTLSEDHERWEAVDTQSLHRPRKVLSCKFEESIPLGYGAAEAADEEQQGQVTSTEHDIYRNKRAVGRASSGIKTFNYYGGLSKVYDLDYENLDDKQFPTSTLAVYARIGKSHLRTADNLNLSVGRLRVAEASDLKYVKSISAAQVFFRKPTQATDGQAESVEFASLYSPYWQVRMVPVNEAQRALAAADRQIRE